MRRSQRRNHKALAREKKLSSESREPVVAGIFYPEGKSGLTELLNRLITGNEKKEKIVAVFVPHAGYLISGSVTGRLYSRLVCPPVAVILGPNHTGVGKPFSTVSKGVWSTPLGKVEVHGKLAKTVLTAAPDLEDDPEAHRDEHSIELQLPFLQRIGKIRAFVPVVLAETDVPIARRIGSGLAQGIRHFGREDVLLVVSANLTRYEPQEDAKAKDGTVIRRILALDELSFEKSARDCKISMCGLSCAVAGIVAAKELGASRAVLVKYQTSGDATGEYGSVVGYAGIIVQ